MTVFGSDVSTFPDLDPTFTPIDGPQAVAECIARRFYTEAGTLPEDPDFGTNILGLLNADVDAPQTDRLRRELIAEILKDDRVKAAELVLEAPSVDSGALRVRVVFTTTDGPFAFVLPIGSVTERLVVTPNP